MDCVTCEKCRYDLYKIYDFVIYIFLFRLWGKLQILGLGTAIKILLTNEQNLAQERVLSRQELVALINTLHQFSKSVEFASDVLTGNYSDKPFQASTDIIFISGMIIVFISIMIIFSVVYQKFKCP
jgi:ERO1-like protein alpha